MSVFKVIFSAPIFVAVFALTNAKPHYGYHQGLNDYYTPPNYDFNYGVSDDYTGSNFGHAEAKHGDQTRGSYYVNLPDGRLQKVTYYVDPYSGYHADVTYIGEAHHPTVYPTNNIGYPSPTNSIGYPSAALYNRGFHYNGYNNAGIYRALVNPYRGYYDPVAAVPGHIRGHQNYISPYSVFSRAYGDDYLNSAYSSLSEVLAIDDKDSEIEEVEK